MKRWEYRPGRDCIRQEWPRRPLRIARNVAFALLLATSIGRFAGGAEAAEGNAASDPAFDTSPVFPLFERPPLPPPLAITGTFGEHRNSHIHAGVDLSTGMMVGLPVTAPVAGWIGRVRSQGVGYGRSLYLHTRDGRIVVFGHLDAFDEPIASYVAAAQDSSGQYDQDLWPDAHRFEVRLGQRLGWSGQSGTNDPHLHLEVRRGDMAINPLRAGLVVADAAAPVVQAVTLEPLDESSWIARSAAPLTRGFGASPETLLAEGRLRATLRAVDPTGRGAVMEPWSVGIEWEGRATEVRFDSVSWATDLPDLDYVYDRGRAAPYDKKTVQVWGSAGARPRVLRAGVAASLDAGLIEVAPGAPPRPLRVWARDIAGNRAERVVWLRGPGGSERGVRAATGAGTAAGFDPLPHGRLRVDLGPGRGAAIVGDAGAEMRENAWRIEPVGAGRIEGFASWSADPGAPFDAGSKWAFRREPRASGAAPELAPISDVLALLPARLPMRTATSVAIRFPSSDADAARVGLYREGDEGWEYLGAERESSGALASSSRRLGRFAAFADTVAPRIRSHAASRARKRGAYSTWALSAPLAEDGSGVDARGTHFIVDGKRVPSEWDPVRGVLRWRPLRAPASGAHRYVVVARDRAGNERRASGRFVLD